MLTLITSKGSKIRRRKSEDDRDNITQSTNHFLCDRKCCVVCQPSLYLPAGFGWPRWTRRCASRRVRTVIQVNTTLTALPKCNTESVWRSLLAYSSETPNTHTHTSTPWKAVAYEQDLWMCIHSQWSWASYNPRMGSYNLLF